MDRKPASETEAELVPRHERRAIERLERQLGRHPEQALQIRDGAVQERDRHRQLHAHYSRSANTAMASHHREMHELAVLLVANCELQLSRPALGAYESGPEDPHIEDNTGPTL